ncbi:hypothetical protein CRE_23525 [Caenorhabditis remanei]|uniref:Uncharacterized protein n=1 Tax=Caenorhabditis remanei TaxID=31234 RepID=E3MH64_CAERE|nr:hypothetical protein CRE_23525 [Caenorhabditis remanei]
MESANQTNKTWVYNPIDEYCSITYCEKQLRKNRESNHRKTQEKICRGCYKKHKLPYGPSCRMPICENRIGGKRKILVCVELPDDICQSCGYQNAMEKLKVTKDETPDHVASSYSIFKPFMESQDLSGSIIQKFVEFQNLTPPISYVSSNNESRESVIQIPLTQCSVNGCKKYLKKGRVYIRPGTMDKKICLKCHKTFLQLQEQREVLNYVGMLMSTTTDRRLQEQYYGIWRAYKLRNGIPEARVVPRHQSFLFRAIPMPRLLPAFPFFQNLVFPIQYPFFYS